MEWEKIVTSTTNKGLLSKKYIYIYKNPHTTQHQKQKKLENGQKT